MSSVMVNLEMRICAIQDVLLYHMQLSKHPNISNERHLTKGLGRL